MTLRASRSKKAGSRRSDLTPVSSILEELKKAGPLKEHLEQARIWAQWPQIAGPKLCAHGQPLQIKKKQLRVEVDSAVWMHRYAFRKAEIIRRVNQIARRELVTDLFLLLADEEERTKAEERE